MAGSARADEPQTAQELLKAIYEPYSKTADFKGQPYWEPQRFFEPALAQAIERDMQDAKKRKEPPTLDGDPFVDAQDWKITGLAYASSMDRDRKKAAGAVTFLNHGEPKGLAVALVNTPNGWRVHDIVGPNGSLRTLFKLK